MESQRREARKLVGPNRETTRIVGLLEKMDLVKEMRIGELYKFKYDTDFGRTAPIGNQRDEWISIVKGTIFCLLDIQIGKLYDGCYFEIKFVHNDVITYYVLNDDVQFDEIFETVEYEKHH